MGHGKRFLKLYGGLERAYTRLGFEQKTNAAGKLILTPYAVNEALTAKIWDDHLAGKYSIGTYPVNEKSLTSFGVIDIDQYDLDMDALAMACAKYPFAVARSKSGGAHLTFFFEEPQPASVVRHWLKNIANTLEIPKYEVFPKQDSIAEGEYGNAINMPYYAGNRTTRYAYVGGEVCSVEEFLDKAPFLNTAVDIATTFSPLPASLWLLTQGTRQPGTSNGLQASRSAQVHSPTTPDMAGSEESNTTAVFDDAPPCLQKLAKQGIHEGDGRNNTLFTFGVYARRKYGEAWEQELSKMNQTLMHPPLAENEYRAVVKSLRKRSYFYKCGDVPMASLCDKERCGKTPYGVGRTAEIADIGLTCSGVGFTDTDPVIWALTLNGVTVTLTTEDLQMQDRFIRKCMERLKYAPPKLKTNDWTMILNQLLKMAVPSEKEDGEASPEAMFENHLTDFCLSKNPARTRNEILRRRAYVESDFVYFRSVDLQVYLKAQQFAAYTAHQILEQLRKRGGMNKVYWWLMNKQYHLWKLPTSAFSKTKNVEETK